MRTYAQTGKEKQDMMTLTNAVYVIPAHHILFTEKNEMLP